MPRSCFLSYASEDQDFVEQLYAGLREKGVECWFAPESLGSGDRFQEDIEQSISRYDKVIVVVSSASVKSRWVEREVNAARDREDTDGRMVLVPIRIDDAVTTARQPWAADFRRLRHIGDFTKWKDSNAYDKAFARLLRDIEREQPKPSAEQKRTPHEHMDRNRRQMLARVRQSWIEGVLHHSLYQVARLELGLEDRPDLLQAPLTLQETHRSARMLPPQQSILTVFDQYADAGGLIIVGGPGAGKTTLLLELTRNLLNRAAEDETHLIPVVFNLSSWAARRAPFGEWLVDELNERYTVPRSVAKQWVADDEILPLLDGLDEVPIADQEGCVKCIDEFRRQHFLPVVVCSRIRAYERLEVRLVLPAAVAVQPLTRQKAEAYLDSGGENLAPLRTLLTRNPALWEIFDSPLMLSVALFAYRDQPEAETLASETLDSQRRHLWEKYVNTMFQRRINEGRFTRECTLQWLIWLAASMTRLGQSMFSLESLNRVWLRRRGQQVLLAASVGLVGAVVGGLAGLLQITKRIAQLTGAKLVFVPAPPWMSALGFALACGVFILGDWKPADRLRWYWPSLQALVREMGRYMVASTVAASMGGAVAGALGIGPLVFGGGLIGPLGPILASMIGYGLIVAVTFALFSIFLEGLTAAQIAKRSVANEGTWSSGRNAANSLLMALGIGATVGLMSEPMALALFGLTGGLATGLGMGLIAGIVLGLFKGGGFFAQHWCMRFLLWRYGYAPFQYVQWLDYAAERIFLHKVGGGYIFVHRMLLEYFASLDDFAGSGSDEQSDAAPQ